MKFGSNSITITRMKQGLTLRQLGALAGISASSIAAIENGKSSPRPSTAKRLCEALGMEFEDLFSLESTEPNYQSGRDN